MSAMTTKSDYIQPSAILPYDSSQSPLALLAQTCSSIGKDWSVTSNPTPPTIPPKSSASVSHSSKKRSSTSQSSASKKSSKERTPPPPPPASFDSTASLADLFLRSPLAYFSLAHSYPTPCTIPDCYQCQTARYILSSSMNIQPYLCQGFNCNARFSTHPELLDHIRCYHSSSKTSQQVRFHPYLKPAKVTHINDPLPLFYPYLSFSVDRLSSHHPNNKN